MMEDTPWSLGPVVMLILPSSFHKARSEPLWGGGGVVPHLNRELTDGADLISQQPRASPTP